MTSGQRPFTFCSTPHLSRACMPVFDSAYMKGGDEWPILRYSSEMDFYP